MCWPDDRTVGGLTWAKRKTTGPKTRSKHAANAALLVTTLDACALQQLAVLLLAHTLPTLLNQRTHKARKTNAGSDQKRLPSDDKTLLPWAIFRHGGPG